MSSKSSSSPSEFESSFTDDRFELLVDLDRVFGSLAHRRRREILGLLDERPEWERKVLATRLAGSQPRRTTHSPTEIEVSLVHTHCHHLEAANLIDVDRESSMIRRGDHYGIVREMVDAASETVEKAW